MKKIILFILITCLACQIVGCKTISSNKPKDNTNQDSATSEQDSSLAEDSTNESGTSGAQGSSDTQTPSTGAQTPSTGAQTPSPTTPTTPTTPKPPVSPNPNGSEQANFGSSEVVEVEEIEEVEIPKVEGEIVSVTSHTALAREQYYQYSGLNASEKQIYQAIYDGIKQCETYINLKSYGCNKETLDKVYHAVTGDNPQFFYLTNLYAYNIGSSGIDKLILLYMDGTTSDVLDDGRVKANANRNTISRQIASFNSKISEILQKISPSSSQIQKEKRIYDYLQDNIAYDHQAAGLIYSDSANASHAFDVYGAACEGKAVCEGYAELFQYLCYCVGINATQVSGTANGGPHMWNTVCIDSNWYMLDVTWDDGETAGMHYYTYFNLTANEMAAANHIPSTTGVRVPSCTSKTHAFYNHFALYVQDLKAAPSNYKKVIDYVVSQGEKTLCIYGEAGSEAMQDYISQQIFGSKSEVQKYIKSKGYKISFESTYYISGKYFYIKIK